MKPAPGRKKGVLSKDEIIRLYVEEGMSTTAIAERDGTSRIGILRILHAAGIQMRPRGGGSHNRWIKHGLTARWEESGVTAITLARMRAVRILGGRCVQCGEDDIRVLEINHLETRGRKLCSNDFYRIVEGVAKDLEVRCANCNILFEYEKGYRRIPSEDYLNAQARNKCPSDRKDAA